MRNRKSNKAKGSVKWVVINILPLLLPLIVIYIAVLAYSNSYFPTEDNTEEVELTIVKTWVQGGRFNRGDISYWLQAEDGSVYRYAHYYNKEIQNLIEAGDTKISSRVHISKNGIADLCTLTANGNVLHDLKEEQRRYYVGAILIGVLIVFFLGYTVYFQPLRLTLRNPEYKRLRRYRKRRRRAIKAKQKTD